MRMPTCAHSDRIRITWQSQNQPLSSPHLGSHHPIHDVLRTAYCILTWASEKWVFFFSILYLMYCKVGRSFPASLTSLHSTRQRWFANPTNIPKEPKNQTNSQHTTLGHWRGGLAKLPAGPAHKYSPSVHKYLPLGVNLFIFSAINNRPQLWSRHEDFYADLDCSGFAW